MIACPGCERENSEDARFCDFVTETLALCVRARIASRRGEHETAVACGRKAVAIADAAEYIQLHIEARLALGEVLVAGGDEDAAPVLGDLLDISEPKGNLVTAARARRLLEQAAVAS